MKHPYFVGLLFVLFFLLTHFFGLYLLGSSAIVGSSNVVSFAETSLGERPVLEDFESIIYIIVGITIGTLILLFFAKKKKTAWWRFWFLLASAIAMSVSIHAAFKLEGFLLMFLSVALASWKIFKPNVVIHNLTEILAYTGIALILAPLFSITAMFIILILVSIYDAYAVWKSKHMVTLAKFTRDSNLFPGFSVFYTENKSTNNYNSNNNVSVIDSQTKKAGILGGGDVVFPLLFSGAVFISFLENGFSLTDSLIVGFVVSLCSSLALFLLFYFGKKDKFYPAMPFLSAGCFFGYLLVLILF